MRQFYPQEYWQDLIDWSTKYLQASINVICDIGCGNGNMISIITKKFPHSKIIGVDLSEESLKYAKERFKSNINVEFKVGSIDSLPLPDGSLDMITCTEVLEHLDMDTLINGFKEISRVLRKGGFLLASVPFEEKLTFVNCPECYCLFHPFQHMIFEISHEDIKTICEKNGMSVISFYQAYDRSIPSGSIAKKILKRFAMWLFPDYILAKFFPKAGATGFIARKNSNINGGKLAWNTIIV